ncbi:MAG: alanine racemase [Geodermatophilaceae bacterium]|nr:alanine racemase [Geodermatophilaceae bacterium]
MHTSRRAEIVVDLDAIADNVSALKARAQRPLMAVVKADGYGHGLIPSAMAAVRGGADMLGVTVIEEALDLRRAGVTVPILAWLTGSGENLIEALSQDVSLSAASIWMLDEIAEASQSGGLVAKVHLKVDTGLSRGGAHLSDWPDLVAAAAAAQDVGHLHVAGIWTHFAYADSPGHPTITAQLADFDEAVRIAARDGLGEVPKHVANSAATLTLPAAYYDMVRPGIAVYGLDPMGGDPGEYGLRPAMTVQAAVTLVKRVPAGSGVSYGHEYTTTQPSTLAQIPVGYADGIPRNATNIGPLWLAGARRRIAGRVCMDQFVVDLGDDPVQAGEMAVLWGPGTAGEPTAQEWATALHTIHYELVSRVGGRMVRRYLSSVPDELVLPSTRS